MNEGTAKSDHVSQPRSAVSALLAAVLIWANSAAGGTGDAAISTRGSGPEQIAVTGIITDESGTRFRLDYGDGEITVEMAGWDWYHDDSKPDPPRLSVGENVTVTGAVDDELLRARLLDALTVFVRDRQSFFVASSADAHDAAWSLRPIPRAPLFGGDQTTASLAGKVTSIAGRELSLDVGGSLITVDTGTMSYNPLDDIGAQRVRKGDWIQTSGELDRRFFEDRRFDAERITSIHRMDVHAM